MNDNQHEEKKLKLSSIIFDFITNSNYDGLVEVFNSPEIAKYFSDDLSLFLTYAVDVFSNRNKYITKETNKTKKTLYANSGSIVVLFISLGAQFKVKVKTKTNDNFKKFFLVERPFLKLLKTNQKNLIRFALENSKTPIKENKKDIRKILKSLKENSEDIELVKTVDYYFKTNVLKMKYKGKMPDAKKIKKKTKLR